MNKFITIILLVIFASSCSNSSIEKKGFQVNEIIETESGERIVGLQLDSLNFETRPRNILLTFNAEHRLTPIYKVNYDKKGKNPFTGSSAFHFNFEYNGEGNNWNNNFMPGFNAIYGYNFVNISHYNNKTKNQNTFFNNPVLIKTLYYPAFSKDTLNFQPISRDYYMVSVYDEDTNKDGFINAKDLRRFYYFDINGQNKKLLIPNEYSVMSSEYDSANDFMYIFAKKDQNKNGKEEANESIDVFCIDLKTPMNTYLQYTSK